jgi:hypothetical protein
LIITPTLLLMEQEAKRKKRKLWTQLEVEMARKKRKHIIGFKLGTLDIPEFLDKDRIVNDRAEYCNWVEEIRRLIESIEKRFAR